MAAAKVTVEAIKYHTNAGKEYQVGDTYEVEESAAANLAAQGMALRTDRVQKAKDDAAAAEESRKARSTSVSPMTTDDLHHPAKSKK